MRPFVRINNRQAESNAANLKAMDSKEYMPDLHKASAYDSRQMTHNSIYLCVQAYSNPPMNPRQPGHQASEKKPAALKRSEVFFILFSA